MSDLSKAIHSAVVSLTVLLILSVTLFAERRSLQDDLLRAERSYLAHQLLVLPASKALPADIQPLYDGPTEQLDDAWATYVNASSAGEIAGLGALSLELPWNLWRMASIPGGRLYYRTDTLSPLEQHLVDEATRSFASCGENASDPAFFLVVDVNESPRNRLVGAPPRLMFSNYELEYQPKDQWYCWKLGSTRAVFLDDESISVTRGKTAEQLAEDVLNLAQEWGAVRSDPVEAYRDLLSRYGAIEGESPQIELPFLSISIPVRWATTALALAGLALIAWTSQVLWQIVRSGGPPTESFWLGTSSLRRLQCGGLDRVLASLELISVLPALCALLLTPVATTAMAIADTWSGAHIALRLPLLAILAVSSALSAGALRSVVALFRTPSRGTGRAEPVQADAKTVASGTS